LQVTLFTPERPQYVFFVLDQRPCFTPKQIITYMLAWGDAMRDFAKIRRGPRFANMAYATYDFAVSERRTVSLGSTTLIFAGVLSGTM
jgi:hypothetical protein